tara:strand:- start:2383 stop:2709 length:327 start_codon:yes stop_codon:yes gene_type:complete
MLRGLKQRVFFAMQNYIKPEEIELTPSQLRALEILAKKPNQKKKKLTLSQQKAYKVLNAPKKKKIKLTLSQQKAYKVLNAKPRGEYKKSESSLKNQKLLEKCLAVLKR